MNLNTKPLSNATFGFEVEGVDLATLTNDTFEALVRLWQEHPLLLLRNQNFTEDEMVTLSRRFGRVDVMVRDDMISKRNPEVIYVTNLCQENGERLGGLGIYELEWHTDQIYRKHPPTGSLFLAIEIPDEGPQTWWCNTQMAFEALPQTLQQELEKYDARCQYGRDKNGGFKRDFNTANDERTIQVQEIEKRTPPVDHPMVLTHPVTGKKSLYFDPAKTYDIVGMPKERSASLLKELVAHSTRKEFTYKHAWRPGDVMLWDNARLWHRRDAFASAMPRLAKRTTIFLPPEKFPAPPPAA